MKRNKIQGILAIMIVGFFLIVSGIIAIYSFANDLQGITDSKVTSEHLKEFSALYSGIIGIIIGYYFGKGGNEGATEKKKVK